MRPRRWHPVGGSGGPMPADGGPPGSGRSPRPPRPPVPRAPWMAMTSPSCAGPSPSRSAWPPSLSDRELRRARPVRRLERPAEACRGIGHARSAAWDRRHTDGSAAPRPPPLTLARPHAEHATGDRPEIEALIRARAEWMRDRSMPDWDNAHAKAAALAGQAGGTAPVRVAVDEGTGCIAGVVSGYDHTPEPLWPEEAERNEPSLFLATAFTHPCYY